MPIRTPPSLADILSQFQAVQQKTAEEGPPDPADPAFSPPDLPDSPAESSLGGQLGATADELVQAVRKLEQADSDKGKAADALKEIALNAANGHTEALTKEAQLLGCIFADAVSSELNKPRRKMEGCLCLPVL